MMEHELKEFTLKYFLKSFEFNTNVFACTYDFDKELLKSISQGIEEVRGYYYDVPHVKSIILMSYNNMGILEKDYGNTALKYYKNSINDERLESVYGHNIIATNMSDEYIFIIDVQSMKYQQDGVNPKTNLIIANSKEKINNE